MNDTALISSLLVYAVIVLTLTIAVAVAGAVGWALVRVADRYTVKHTVTEQAAALYIQQQVDTTDNDLLH